MRKFLVAAITVAVLGSAVGVSVGVADPNLELTTTPHRHYINGRQVGPLLCDNPALLDAFDPVPGECAQSQRGNGRDR